MLHHITRRCRKDSRPLGFGAFQVFLIVFVKTFFKRLSLSFRQIIYNNQPNCLRSKNGYLPVVQVAAWLGSSIDFACMHPSRGN